MDTLKLRILTTLVDAYLLGFENRERVKEQIMKIIVELSRDEHLND